MRAYPIYLGIRGAFALFFALWATVAAVYRIEVVGLDPLRLVLLGTALEVAVFVFEVPTGVFADTFGRRRSVIIGCILMGSGFALEGAIPTFAAVLAAQAVWGVGYTFISGALEAWIADEAPDRDLGRVYLRGEQADYLGSFVGIPAGRAPRPRSPEPAAPRRRGPDDLARPSSHLRDARASTSVPPRARVAPRCSTPPPRRVAERGWSAPGPCSSSFSP